MKNVMKSRREHLLTKMTHFRGQWGVREGQGTVLRKTRGKFTLMIFMSNIYEKGNL